MVSGTTTENLSFIHQKASGLSIRKTRTASEHLLGIPSYDPLFIDPAQAELDVGGTNAGLIPLYTPQYGSEYPQFPPFESDEPLWINGQRVTATLDGMAISWQMVRNLLDHGAAVPVGIDNLLRAARGRDINLQYTGSGRYTFRDFTYDGPGSRYIGVTFDFSFNFGTQQQTQDEKYTQEKKDCDKKLSGIFGSENTSAAGSGFEPDNLFGKIGGRPRAGSFRGGEFGHLNNALHLYYGDDAGENAGEFEGDVFIPEGGEYVGPNPLVSSEASHLFFYKKLGNLTNVFLTTSHINGFIKPNGITKGKTKIGQIGGEGGNSLDKKNESIAGKYLHSHFTIFNGTYNYNKKKKRKVASIRNERNSFFNTFCK